MAEIVYLGESPLNAGARQALQDLFDNLAADFPELENAMAVEVVKNGQQVLIKCTRLQAGEVPNAGASFATPAGATPAPAPAAPAEPEP